jgi:hypothetical protein
MKVSNWQIGRLADWQLTVGRLADWQIGRLADWQIGRLAEKPKRNVTGHVETLVNRT